MKTIKDLPEHSRPREKLRERGASTLTDEELVTAILGMGLAKASQILSAFELARRYLLKDTVKISCAKDILPLLTDIAAKQ